MKILSLDPGSQITGYALLDENSRGEIQVIHSGIIKLTEFDTLWLRIQHMTERLESIISKGEPQHVAFESLIFVKNPASLMKLAQMRGAMISVLSRYHLPMYEYAPNLIKQTIAGHGHADKEEIQRWVRLQTGYQEFHTHDESDAIAIGICHWLNVRKKIIPQIKNQSSKEKNKSLKSSLLHAVKEQQ